MGLGFFVLLPLYAKDLKGTKRTLLSLVELLIPIAFVAMLAVLYINYSGYYLASITVDIGAMGSIKLLFVLVMLMLQHRDDGWEKADSNAKGMMALASMGILIAFIGYFFSNIDRIALFYLMYEPILYGFLIKHGSKTVSRCTWIFVSVLAVYSIASTLVGDTQGIIPYSTCSVLQLFK